MRYSLKIAAAFFIVACSINHAAFAGEPIPPSPIAKTELLIDAPRLKQGEPIWAAVRFTLPEHWHIYWQNPGDSGVPTSYAWTLPEGLAASAIHWPVPERIEVEGLVNFGYSNQVTLPVQLSQARDDISGTVQVKATWLVCRDVCIPENALLQGELTANPAAGLAIAAARTQVPGEYQSDASYVAAPDGVTLSLSQSMLWGDVQNVAFYPIDDGIIQLSAKPNVSINRDVLNISFPRGSADAVDTWNGLLRFTENGKESAVYVHAKNLTPVAPPAPTVAQTSFIVALGLAFLGGLILNIMPCVLPILALKALALAKKAKASRAAAARQGIAYTVGVIASFMLIAAIMLALKASGAAIGWGFQLQNPAFVAALAVVMVLVAANLLGLFHLPVLFGEKATGINENSLRGSVLTGVLAVLVATPCTAPFMATAVGATLSLPTALALLVFATLGLGMAAPFLLISFWPAALRLIPKPGAWMNRFKHILAIPMLATAAWLVWVLVQIITIAPMEISHLREPYSASRLSELRAKGTPVLVDATAAWCLTCKVNERVALNPESTQQLLRERNVVTMVADWTMSDPEITTFLASFGRNGVPLVVYYPPQHEGVVLPQLLTTAIVREAITKNYTP